MNEHIDRFFLVLGIVVVVALICFTILAALGADAAGTMRDVLLGLVACLTGVWAVVKHRNGKENGKG
jgi:hypothetical protein